MLINNTYDRSDQKIHYSLFNNVCNNNNGEANNHSAMQYTEIEIFSYRIVHKINRLLCDIEY